jgi:hypothetical protein
MAPARLMVGAVLFANEETLGRRRVELALVGRDLRRQLGALRSAPSPTRSGSGSCMPPGLRSVTPSITPPEFPAGPALSLHSGRTTPSSPAVTASVSRPPSASCKPSNV